MRVLSSKPLRLALAAFALPLASACSFQFEVNSQRTALENQVLGSYKEIEDDLVLISSVRSPSAKAPQLSAGRKRTVQARANQDFNRDDVDELKEKGILGEAADGTLALVAQGGGAASAPDLKLARELIQEENRDRAEIWRGIIAANDNLSDKDLPEVRRTYAKLQRESAAPTHWIQTEDGRWRQGSSVQ